MLAYLAPDLLVSRRREQSFHITISEELVSEVSSWACEQQKPDETRTKPRERGRLLAVLTIPEFLMFQRDCDTIHDLGLSH